MSEVPAKFIPFDAERPPLTPHPSAPGEFRYEAADAHNAAAPPAPGQLGRLNHACPRGTGICGSILIGNGFKPDVPGRATWRWDGNVENPTLTPSINCLAHEPGNPSNEYAGCGWHGYLTSGVFRD